MLGEEAREYGLKFSLLERLQDLYQQCGGNALEHMVSLNTNYRCHKEIVKIPSELFYESKIKIRPQSASAHPQAKYPLVFVCSALTMGVDNKCEANVEANVLLRQLENFVVLNWPDSWGEKDLSKICLVTASRTQVLILGHWCNCTLWLFHVTACNHKTPGPC